MGLAHRCRRAQPKRGATCAANLRQRATILRARCSALNVDRIQSDSRAAAAPAPPPASRLPPTTDRAKRNAHRAATGWRQTRSEEHTSELQSLMRISYAVFCLKKKKYN